MKALVMGAEAKVGSDPQPGKDRWKGGTLHLVPCKPATSPSRVGFPTQQLECDYDVATEVQKVLATANQPVVFELDTDVTQYNSKAGPQTRVKVIAAEAVDLLTKHEVSIVQIFKAAAKAAAAAGPRAAATAVLVLAFLFGFTSSALAAVPEGYPSSFSVVVTGAENPALNASYSFAWDDGVGPEGGWGASFGTSGGGAVNWPDFASTLDDGDGGVATFTAEFSGGSFAGVNNWNGAGAWNGSSAAAPEATGAVAGFFTMCWGTVLKRWDRGQSAAGSGLLSLA